MLANDTRPTLLSTTLNGLSPLRCRLILVIVLLLGFAGHVGYLLVDPPIGLSGDEAHYWDWSRQLDLSYYSKGPLVAYVIRAGCWLFGDTEFGVRFPALVLGLATSLCTYWLTLRTFRSDRLALGAVLLCHIVPMFIAGSLLMTIDPPYYLAWATATCLAHVAIFDNRRWPWPLVGVAIGLGFLAKYAALLWLVSLLIFLLWRRRYRFLLRTNWPYLATTIALIFTTPVLIWNARHDWVTFGHVARTTAENHSSFDPLLILKNIAELVGGQIGILNPLVALFMIGGIITAMRATLLKTGVSDELSEDVSNDLSSVATNDSPNAQGNNLPNHLTGENHPQSSTNNPAAPADKAAKSRSASLAPRATEPRDRLAFLLSFGLPFFLFVSLITIFKAPEQNWPAVCYFTLIPLAAWFVATHARAMRGFLIAAVIVGLIAMYVLHYSSSLYPYMPLRPRKWDPAARIYGFRELGQEASDLRLGMGPQTFILCDRYQTAGLMAFYVTGQPKTYCIGSYLSDPAQRDRLSQYDMWPDRALDQPQLIGRDAVFVGNAPPDLYNAFARVEQMPDLEIARHGVKIRSTTLFRCYGFKGMTHPTDGKTKR